MAIYRKSSRRKFLEKVALGTGALTIPNIVTGKTGQNRVEILHREYRTGKYSANDKINLATIGFGIQGIGDTATAIEVSGVKLVGVCDLYTGRLERARELHGNELVTTRDYREILADRNIDAVIIATPDHWHRRIAVEAMKAGKAVYLEKPMIQKVEEGQDIIQTEKENKAVLQIGSQGISSLGNEKARELFREGVIGDLVMVEIFNDRFSSEGAWQYPVPPDASPQTIDFDTFLGNAPKVAYDPVRFFRWRNYQDYGTGVAGDLFVHSFTTLHYVIDSKGPERARSTGGLRYWKDGRDVPDIMMCLYDFPEAESHPAFNAILRINFVAGNGGGGGFRLIGSEGEMSVGYNSITVRRNRMGMKPSGYSLRAYTNAVQEQIRQEYDKKFSAVDREMNHPEEIVYQPPGDYKGGDYDHFYNFFGAMRGERKIVENGTYGLRAAGAALLANYSYYRNEIVNWNPDLMQLV
ncbi:MAG: Gfo/Idh/MocA family oxidoreductase [Cyclobacteriaceae bacterium]|nr:Gfo/Idh/MocA family oxidoreductase [Cyclobacteriaceae bacterium]